MSENEKNLKKEKIRKLLSRATLGVATLDKILAAAGSNMGIKSSKSQGSPTQRNKVKRAPAPKKMEPDNFKKRRRFLSGQKKA